MFVYHVVLIFSGIVSWTPQHTLKPSDLQDKANFGRRIASSLNHIVVVAPGDYSAQDGTVYAYKK